MRFRKVKLTKDKKVHVIYEKSYKNECWDEYSFTCSDAPAPEFEKAMAALAPFVIEMCELNPKHQSRISVRSVSASYAGENDVLGIVISAQKGLEHSNSPLNINTPYKIQEPYKEGAEGDQLQLMPPNCSECIQELFDQAEKYIKGHRLQTDLFDKKGKGTKKKEAASA